MRALSLLALVLVLVACGRPLTEAERAYMADLQENRYWLGQLERHHKRGTDPAAIFAREAEVAASINGVLPLPVTTSLSAAYASNSAATSSWPWTAARCKAVYPSLSA